MKIQSFKILNGKAFVVQIVILLLVLVVIGYGLYYSNTKNGFVSESVTIVNDSELKTMKVTIQVPDRLEQYLVEMNKYIYEGARNPSNSWKFVSREVTVYSRSEDIVIASAQAAAEQIDTQGGIPSAEVVYFKIVNKSAYILLAMQIDSWLGTSASLAKIKPLVEQTLFQFQGVDSVVFDVAPGDNIEQVSRSYKRKYITVSLTNDVEQLKIGNKYEIVWRSSSNSELVRLFLIPGNIPITSLSNAAAGFSSPFDWTIDKKILPGKYKIEARQYSDYSDVPILIAIDQSGEFTITENNTPTPTPQPIVKVSPITVLSPNGGEVWVRNSYNTISWDVSNKTESTLFDIKLVRKNSTSPATTAFIQEGQSSSQNKYLWKTGDTYSTMFVPSTGDSTVEFPGAGQYVIHVCIHQTDNCDSSDANFTFKEPSVRVIAPNNSGLQLVSGSAYQIKWEYFNATNTSQVDLYLEKINDFDCYNSIKSLDCSLSNRSSEIILDKNIPSNTAYYWVVGTDIANKPINPGDYRMKICVAGTADCDVASLYFYIKPSPTQPHITVISPNGGEVFVPGSRVPIIWKDNANYSKVKIMVVAGRREDGHYTNNGSMGTYRGYTIYEGENTGKFDWVVPTQYPGSGKYLIRIDPQDGIGSVGYSDNYFTILKSTNSSPRIEPIVLPNSPFTSYYSQELEVIGFATSTVNWQIVGGSLPPGLYLEKQGLTCTSSYPPICPRPETVMFKALIAGGGRTPKPGNYNFTVKASNDTQSVTKTYSLNLY